jgi:hypothetical protein
LKSSQQQKGIFFSLSKPFIAAYDDGRKKPLIIYEEFAIL